MNDTGQWQHDGYLVFLSAFDPMLIEQLREVCDGALGQWQRESVLEGEPGQRCYGPTAWIMLHLNHPKYHRQLPDRLGLCSTVLLICA